MRHFPGHSPHHNHITQPFEPEERLSSRLLRDTTAHGRKLYTFDVVPVKKVKSYRKPNITSILYIDGNEHMWQYNEALEHLTPSLFYRTFSSSV